MLPAGAFEITLFLVLPLIQAIGDGPSADTTLRSMDTGQLPPPPPPPPPEEPEEEQEAEEEPPELVEDIQPLDLSQLELALNPSVSDGMLGGDFALNLTNAAAKGSDVDALFSLSELDQKPRVVHQVSPFQNAKTRKKAPGTVFIIFAVDKRGKVQDPKIQSATDPVFERPALTAIKQWRFEPGKKNGKPVSFRMRIPITFPAQAQ